MAAPASIDELLDLVRKSGVVEEKRLDAYLQKMRAAPGMMPEEPGKLAGLMVRDGILTHFQAEQFLLGKWRRFTIGKYKVLERLGSGGMGSVYLCEHKVMRRRAAVKVLPAAKAEDPAALERFYREARAVAALDHPNIVRAYDIDQDEKLHFLVMEHVDGSSLQEIIKKFGPMDITRAAHYIRQAAVGLQHAHQVAGIVHRDIKPGNVLVDRTGMVKILDMGLARFFHDEEDLLTKKYDENVLGTADYLAPEQALDSHSVDIRADIYSLGATFYFLLTGSTPFSDGTVAQKLIWHQTRQPKLVRTIRLEVPVELAAVLEKMMAKAPSQRYQMPSEVVDALAPWTQQEIPPPPEREMPYLSPAAQGTPSPGEVTTTHTSLPRTPAPPPFKVEGAPTPTAINPRPGTRPAQPPTPAPRPTVPAGNLTTPQPASSRRNTVALAPSMTPAPSPAAAANNGKALPTAVQAPVPVQPEQPVWQEPAPETDDLTADLDTVPTAPLSARDLSAAQLKSRRMQIVIIGSAAGALLLTSVLLWTFFGGKEQPTTKGPSGPTALRVSQSGGPDTFKTVRHALMQARPGDRIVVLDETIQEQLILDDRKLGKEVTIEGGLPDRRVLWTCPDKPKDDRFIRLSAVTGLRLKNFLFDGREQVKELVSISDKCPGLVLEDIEMQNFTRNAVSFWNCTAENEASAVTLARIRIVTAKPVESAIIFYSNPSVAPAFNQQVIVSDCRFEGPYQSAIQIAGTIFDVQFRRNRFYKATDGIFYRTTKIDFSGKPGPIVPRHAIKLDLIANTFSDVSKGLHLEGMPVADGKSQVVVKSNLFANTAVLAHSDEPVNPAQLQVVVSPPGSNVCDMISKEGNVPLQAKPLTFDLPKDPGFPQFLLYSKENPLAKAGLDQTPVGVPPGE